MIDANDLAANKEYFDILGNEILESIYDLDAGANAAEFLDIVNKGTALSLMSFLLGVGEAEVEDTLRELITEPLVGGPDEE